MSLSEDWLNGYRKHALPSPRQWTLSALKIRHEAFLDNVEQALRHSSDGLILRLLDIHEVGREIRRQTERHSTPRNWQPHLPEDAQPAGYRWTDDESVLHAPSLHLQLFNTQVTTQGNWFRQADSGTEWYRLLYLRKICRRLTNWSVPSPRSPRRIRMDLMPGGMKALNLENASDLQQLHFCRSSNV